MARHSWDVVNPSLNKLEKEVVVPKETKISKEAGYSTQARRAATTDGYGKLGFFYPTEVAYRVFPPLTQLQGFSSCKYTSFPPCDRVVCVGYIGSISDVKQ